MDFDSNGVRLHYEVHGPERGAPLVVVHGFASDYRLNWVGTRWQEALTNAGFRVFGLDCRGHGHSDKPHDRAAYSIDIMAGDVARLLDHVNVPAADYLGYSMGARIGLQVVLEFPTRVRRAVLGGIGTAGAIESADAIAEAFLGAEPTSDPVAQTFYRFASARPTNDLKALAACITGLRPVDELAVDAPELVELMPSSHLVTVPGRDHMGTVPAKEFKQAAIEFLSAE
jgi:pimeloyl-ACP methyl ester carboxylesterase